MGITVWWPSTWRTPVGRVVIAIAFTMAIASFAITAAADDRAEALADLTAPLAAGKQLKLTAILKLHDTAGLEELIREQQDPSSPNYHKWLTPDEFTQRYGPTDADIEHVTKWLQAKGFAVTSSSAKNRMVVFQGTAKVASKAFAVDFAATADGRIFASTKDVAIPQDVAALVDDIRGLDNLAKAYPIAHLTAPDAKIDLAKAFGPQDLYSFYDENPLLNATPTPIDGRNTDCVAIVEDSNFNTASTDAFNAQFGLPAFHYSLTPGTNFHYIFADLTDPGNLGGGEELEALLDLEYSHSAAPGATVVNYIGDAANSSTGLGFLDGVLAAIGENRCGTISISFGICGAPPKFFKTIDTFFAQAALQGQAVVIASGDEGAANFVFRPKLNACVAGKKRGVEGLQSSPNVTSIGGTMFTPVFDTNGNNVGSVPESVWNDASGAGSGGKSPIFKKPDYQQAGTPKDHRRDTPDVSFGGSPNSPGYFIGAAGTVECCVGGTSIGAPSWAGITMLLQQENAGRIGLLNPTLYSIAPSGAEAGIRDVVSGNNSFNGVKGYQAVPGYDLASGWGTPDIADFVNAYIAALGSPK